MDNRAAKLASARKKLRDHQEKKSVCTQKEEISDALHSSEHLVNKKCIDQAVIKHEDNLHICNQNENNEELSLMEISYDNINYDASSTRDNNCYANVTEILISNKTNLELQNKELQSKILQLERIYSKEVDENNINKQKLVVIQEELNESLKKYAQLKESISNQESLMKSLRGQIESLTDDKNNLKEKLELTRTILTTKEMEVSQVNSQLNVLQNQMDVVTLQLQQLTSDTNFTLNQDTGTDKPNDALVSKIEMLKNQLDNVIKEKDQITVHYEQYVIKLNEQFNLQLTKNAALTSEINDLHNRESALIEQIGQMEIRMQNYRKQTEAYSDSYNTTYNQELNDKIAGLQTELDELNTKYKELEKQHEMSLNQIQQLNQTNTQELCHENISLKKLNADITSDKVAAQRAAEQNKKMKIDIEELQQIVVKMGKDKLELTEKLSHEKQLNKQLTLKFAETDETLKQMQTKLIAKDEEMIRLQNNYREIENKHETLLENLLLAKETAVTKKINVENTKEVIDNGGIDHSDCDVNAFKEMKNENDLPEGDAMFKLQERFLNIMDQVANLSDEKHRLEHIILQLQTETDTICEYVALYQQQRSLLKKRDEERSSQMKLFQLECNEVKRQLEELSGLFLKLAQDKDLSDHLQVESKHNDVVKIKSLLENLLNSSLINSKCLSLELKNFYPCSCCSGQLIDV